MATERKRQKESDKYLKYARDIFSSKTGPDLLATGVYPSFKEYAESAAAFRAYRKYLHGNIEEGLAYRYWNKVVVYCVGDGTTPRTGVMFAMRTTHKVVSIDPLMNERYQAGNPLLLGPYCKWDIKPVLAGKDSCQINRLTCYKEKIEEHNKVIREFGDEYGNVFRDKMTNYDDYTSKGGGIPDVAIIVGVHSHAPLKLCLETIKAKRRIYAILMPCCVDLLKDMTEKVDYNVIASYCDDGIPSMQRQIFVVHCPTHSVKATARI